MKKILLIIGVLIISLVAGLAYFFWSPVPLPAHITWGINFSKDQAQALHLDWKQAYASMLDDLGVKQIKLITEWPSVQKSQGQFDFADINWQIQEAQNHGASVMYVVGLKTGHWPECHVPDWLNSLSAQDQQKALLQYVAATISRYKNNSAIASWQVENEPLFHFGVCPSWYYDGGQFLQKEIALVASLDSSRPIIVSDSGEQSWWFSAARLGDVVGTTLYRKVWVHVTDHLGFYGTMWFPPKFYWLKSQLISAIFHKKVINVELQAEPWTQGFFYDAPLSEQEKTINPAQFASTVEFAKKTGMDEFYFWGAEYWYWLKTTQNRPEIWNEAKTLFQ